MVSPILFAEDWKKWPRAVIDTQTPNRAWLDLAYKYKSVGIKNHAFMLALHNPALAGLDPHDPNLTHDQMVDIGVECEQNFWYLARNVWKAPPNAGVIPDPISANRANISLWWSYFNHLTYMLTQPRQTGKSFCTDILMLSLLNFLCRNTQINLLTKDETLRMANIERLKKIYDELPAFLKYRDPRKDTNNSESFSVKIKNNIYYAHVPQSSPKAAYKLGRGLTSPTIQADELPFQPNAKISFGSAIGAMGAAMEKAEKDGEPYGIVITTTAGSRDDPSGAFAYGIAEESAPWSDPFFDARDRVHLEEMVRKHSPKKVFQVYGCFSHIQMGKDDAWLKNMLEKSKQSPEDANKDFFNIWSYGNSRSPIHVDLLGKLNANIWQPQYDHHWPEGDYILSWFIPAHEVSRRMSSGKQIIGIDTSEAIGRDDIGFTMTDVETGETLCKGRYNNCSLNSFFKFVGQVLKHLPNTILVPERKSTGVALIDFLMDTLPHMGVDPFKRIFNMVAHDPALHPGLFSEAQEPMSRRDPSVYQRAKRYFGFGTNGSGETSRDSLYGCLEADVTNCWDRIRDPDIIGQIKTLVIKNNRIDHGPDDHDDMVVSRLLTIWFLTKGKNLSWYGINPVLVLSGVKIFKPSKVENSYQQAHQNRLKKDIQVALSELQDEVDPYVILSLERKIRFLNSQVIQEDQGYFSVDAMIEEIRKNKSGRRGRLLR